ncbi:MAG: carboxy-S-adenosyl-L-methionine synthase CmoA [Cocleimonas sp.]
MKKDKVFAKDQQVVDFTFDDTVADVFPDMIRRSVPGYETVISLLGVLASDYAQDHSRIYDLGSSLGAATLSIHSQTRMLDLEYICVDNSKAMVKRSQTRLARQMPEANLHILCDDITQIDISNASVVVINFTLQFLAPESRLQLLQKIYKGLKKGGVLILSEKLVFVDSKENQQHIKWHHRFKSANGYSDLEISQKRAAIENVLIPDTLEVHQSRLQEAGFEQSWQWFQSFNFASLIAVKS